MHDVREEERGKEKEVSVREGKKGRRGGGGGMKWDGWLIQGHDEISGCIVGLGER